MFAQNAIVQEIESNEVLTKNSEFEVRNLIWLSEKAILAEKNDSALNYASKAKELTQANFSNKLKARVSYWLAKSLYSLNQFDVAEQEYHTAITFSARATDTLQLAICYNDLGRLFKKTANYSDALNSFNMARKYYFVAGDSLGLALVNLNVGNVLKSIGRNELAKKKYRLALNVFKLNGDEYNEAGCYNNLGNIYKNEEKFDSAFYYMYKTLHIREHSSDKSFLGFIYHNLANLHLAINNTDSALFYINKSLVVNQSINGYAEIASDYNVFGSIYIALKNWKKAIEYLEQSRMFNEKIGIIENKLDNIKQLAIANHHLGNYKFASELNLEYNRLNDSIIKHNENSSIEKELIYYELFADSIKTQQLLLEKNLVDSKKEIASLTNTSTIRNFTYAFIIALLIISMVIVFYFSARKRLTQTREHETVLRIQNEELKRTLISKEEKEILLKEVHHRVKNNLQIINSLIRLQSNFMNANNFKEKLIQTENRIRSMALIHEKLYKTGNLASLSVRNYIEELCINIIESYENHNVKIKLKFDLEEREYGIDTLIPIGLIINEALSNAMKHAFYDRSEGNVRISLQSANSYTRMTISDDGLGADLSFDELKEDSLGMELITSLTDQLDGKLILTTTKGFDYQFEFPLLK